MVVSSGDSGDGDASGGGGGGSSSGSGDEVVVAGGQDVMRLVKSCLTAIHWSFKPLTNRMTA